MGTISVACLCLIPSRTAAQTTYTPYSFSRFAGSHDLPGDGAQFVYPLGMTVDTWGNLFVADAGAIRKITPKGVVTTLAGQWNGQGSADGVGSEARFLFPEGVAVDASGNVYVADTSNHTIRKIAAGGLVSTVAGLAGANGSADGTGSEARFNAPTGVAVDSWNNVYVADRFNFTVRKITASGAVTTLAGLAGTFGSADGAGSEARFKSPEGVAVDGSGNVYVADTFNSTIRRITPAGVVTTLAGLAETPGSTDGTGSVARFYYPTGLTMHASGTIYVTDGLNHTIRKITPEGVVTTLAGLAGLEGSTDGPGTEARFKYPAGLAVYSSGEVFVADTYNSTIRRITPTGMVTTLTGRVGLPGSVDGNGVAVRLDLPYGVAADDAGNVYVASTFDFTIRRIAPGGLMTTLAGSGNQGSTDGTGSEAQFNFPHGLAVNGSGDVYVSDTSNFTIRRITPAGVVTTLAGLAGVPGSADGTGSDARFEAPKGVAVDLSGNVYVADNSAHTIRKITPVGAVTTLAGLAGVAAGNTDGTGGEARFNSPEGVAVDDSGKVYVADTLNHTIRRITPGGVVTTMAGVAGVVGSADGVGPGARFTSPTGVATDAAGNIFVVDRSNRTIRRITPSSVVTTLAGLAGTGGSADGTGSEVRFSDPTGVSVDPLGTIYIVDQGDGTIRRGIPAFPLISPAASGPGQFQFTFNTLAGVDYTIQYTTIPNHWAFLRAFTGSGGPVSIVESNITGPQRYYRVQSP